LDALEANYTYIDSFGQFMTWAWSWGTQMLVYNALCAVNDSFQLVTISTELNFE